MLCISPQYIDIVHLHSEAVRLRLTLYFQVAPELENYIFFEDVFLPPMYSEAPSATLLAHVLPVDEKLNPVTLGVVQERKQQASIVSRGKLFPVRLLGIFVPV
jgi:hypothetical protein